MVTGRDARWVSAESTAIVFSESSMGKDGKPNVEKRELGLRMRGTVVGLM
jgi:hypothetical protein